MTVGGGERTTAPMHTQPAISVYSVHALGWVCVRERERGLVSMNVGAMHLGRDRCVGWMVGAMPGW